MRACSKTPISKEALTWQEKDTKVGEIGSPDFVVINKPHILTRPGITESRTVVLDTVYTINPGEPRNQPEIYEEIRQSTSLALTPTAKDILRSLAAAQEISQSEFIERLLREKKRAKRILNYSVGSQKTTN